MMAWDLWKQGFDAWENATAEYLENLLENESVLGPAGAMLTLAMKTKVTTDKMLSAWWGAMGLPTKRDQERSLHKLNQIESRLLDLEEMIQNREDQADPPDVPETEDRQQAADHPEPAAGNGASAAAQ